MDIKKLLTKIEECKKESQRKELVKNLCNQILKPKNQNILNNYQSTIMKRL